MMKPAVVSALLLAAVLTCVALNSRRTLDFAGRVEAELAALEERLDDPEACEAAVRHMHESWTAELPRLLVTMNKTGLLSAGEAFDRLIAHAGEPGEADFTAARRQLALTLRYIRSLEMTSRCFG